MGKPDFTLNSNYNEKASFRSLRFGANAPVLETELNELQDIINGRQTDLIKNVFGDGVMGVGEYLVNNTQFTLSNEIVLLNGELLHVAPTTITVAEGNNVFVNMWYEDILATSTVKEWGNKQSTNNVQNKLIDPRLGFETSRRVQVVFQLATTEKSGAFNLKLGNIRGGNFIKTCNILKSPMSETLKGEFITCTNTTVGDLLDVKLYGKSVQNPSNLVDIKSVGIDNGDGTWTYEVATCGENMFNHDIKESGKVYSVKLPVGQYTFSCIGKATTTNRIGIWVFNEDGTQIASKALTNDVATSLTFNNIKNQYVGFKIMGWDSGSVMQSVTQPQLQTGAIATDYVPYEGRVNRLKLPCPLEKWDTIYFDEKENAWCIEKYTNKFKYTNETIVKGAEKSPQGFTPFLITHNFGVQTTTDLLCNMYTPNDWGSTYPCTYLQVTEAVILTTITDLAEFTSHIEGLEILYKASTPQKIVLPKQAQIDLNSFFGVTHAWVNGGEVNGEIEITFPKSLMSSVQSNSKAIDKIQEDIKDIDNIRESQDYSHTSLGSHLACSDTREGVVRDIKMYGKTIRNLCPTRTAKATGDGAIHAGVSVPLKFDLEDNKEYTLMCRVTENTTAETGILALYDSQGSGKGAFIQEALKPITGKYVLRTVKTNRQYGKAVKLMVLVPPTATNGSIFEVDDIMVFEGALTENLPYIEDFASVGNDTEGITVASDNNVLNEQNMVEAYVGSEDGKTFVTNASAKNTRSYIFKCPPNAKVTIKKEQVSSRFVVGTLNRLPQNEDKLNILYSDSSKNITTVTTPSDTKYMVVYVTNDITTSDPKNTYISVGSVALEKERNYDEKKAMFKNSGGNWEYLTDFRGIDQTYCDTIEQHSDGKYYLHVRTRLCKGSELVGLTKEQNFTDREGYYGFITMDKYGISLPSNTIVPTNPYIYCNNLKNIGALNIIGGEYSDKDCIAYDPRYRCVRISVAKGTDIKTYLASKNIQFVIPVDEQIYPLNALNVGAYPGNTNVYFYTGKVTTKTDFKLTSNLGNLVKENGMRTDNLEDMSANMLLELAMKADLMHRHMNVTSQADGFMSKEDKTKLDGIQANANNYVHPNTPEIRHVTDAEKASWNAKPTTTDVENRIKAIIGSSPASLDTLKELADALNNDPNFATNIINQLGNKADKVHTHDDRYYTEAESDTRFFANNLANMDAGSDFNNAITQGKYTVSSSASLANAPFSGYIYGTLIVYVRSYGGIAQDFISTGNVRYTRVYDSTNKVWTNWTKTYSENAPQTWGEVTGKPSTFPPSTHTHDDRYYTESESDSRFFRLNVAGVEDFNNAKAPGTYSLSGNIDRPNSPIPGSIIYGTLEVIPRGADLVQRVSLSTGAMFIRYFGDDAQGWRPWIKVFTDGNKPTWNDVTNKPTSFTPASHNHDDRYFTENEADGRYFRTFMGNITSASDFNTIKEEGEYPISSGTPIPNGPNTGGGMYGTLICYKRASDGVHQIFLETSGRVFRRYFNANANTWQPWLKDFNEFAKPTWNEIEGKPSTFAPSSHNHDDRYFTESEADGKYLGKTAKASDSEKLDGIDSTGFGRAYASSQSFGGNDGNITTEQFINLLTTLGAFNTPYWVARGSWAYANNQKITDTGCGTIHLAGCTIEVMGNASTYTIRIHTATTSSGGVVNGDYIYVNNGSTYSPGWRKLYNTGNKPTPSEIGASPSNHNHDGRYIPIIPPPTNEVDATKDFNDYTTVGMYGVSADTNPANSPYWNKPLSSNYGQLICINRGPDDKGITQLFLGQNGDMFSRVKLSSQGVWTEWQQFYSSNRGTVANFNDCIKEGMWIVGSNTALPNAPYATDIFGILEVMHKRTELIQRFTNNAGEIYIRFYNYQGVWSSWNKLTSMRDFVSNTGETGYIKLPGGLVMQRGKFETSGGIGRITFPIAFADNLYSIVGNPLDPGAHYVSFRSNTASTVEVTCDWTSSTIRGSYIAIGRV